MRILITQREMVHFGGTEMVTVEIAKELTVRGHDVVVFSPRLGEVCRLLWPGGVRAVSQLESVPWQPELIHGHHHLPAMAALARFESARAIYYSHGAKPWVEQPPLHQRIQNYVVMCEWMVKRFVAQLALDPEHVSVVPNFVNVKRFSGVRVPPNKPAKALLYHVNGLSTVEFAKLKAGCSAFGITLDQIGPAFENIQTRPEMFLQLYDLVFASGKSALEAMAAGCAVMTLMGGKSGALVTIENFEEWAFVNFGPGFLQDATLIDETWLRRELEKYSADDAAKVTAKVREERTLDGSVNKLEAIYQAAMGGELPMRSSSASFAPYLEQLANEADALWCESNEARAIHDYERSENNRLIRQVAETTKLLPNILKKVRSIERKKSFWKRVRYSSRKMLGLAQ
jgi:hypothetical protein